MVVAELLIGNHGRALAMSITTRRCAHMFWELIDERLNAVLFALIAMEVLLITCSQPLAVAGAAAVGVTLAARWLSVGLPFRLPSRNSAKVHTAPFLL